jgi:hypothetical protein
MKQRKNSEQVDFEELGFKTRLETESQESAKEICALRIHEYERGLQPIISQTSSHIQEHRNRDHALHVRLYDRPIPVNDAAMIVRSMGARTLLALAILVAIASLAGNVTLFYLFGFGVPVTILLAIGATALPLAIGHLAYEKIIAPSKALQIALILGVAALCAVGIMQLGQARRTVIDKAVANENAASYVDQAAPDTALADEAEKKPPQSESKARQTLGGAMFTMLVAADLVLGFLAGLLARLRSDEDYAAWRELKRIRKTLPLLEKELSELIASIEIAKVRCMAGILRAESVLRRRRPPYYKALAAFILGASLLSLPGSRPLSAQTVEHYEGILIDTSGSIARGGASNDLFREYMVSTRNLLFTEPASSRVWVSVISTDSFGRVHELLKGWTPDAHGVFTDDLTRARHQLAVSFEQKSSGMAPVAAGTDIIGGLWHMKTLFEADHGPSTSRAVTKTIWILSDMMNETPGFPMPSLLGTGPEQMLERAKDKKLLVPLDGYTIHIQGTSPAGLSPQAWLTIKRFWEMYFEAAGAQLVSYSPECSAAR